jgi:hypothetical protein
MTRREMMILGLLGFGVWLNGAVMFRFGGTMMFESGPVALGLSGLAIGVSVCVLLRSIMSWRKVAPSEAVSAAVILILPGLFGDVAYILKFSLLTGLRPETAGPFAAVLIFGTAVLLAYALWLARTVRIP